MRLDNFPMVANRSTYEHLSTVLGGDVPPELTKQFPENVIGDQFGFDEHSVAVENDGREGKPGSVRCGSCDVGQWTWPWD